MENIKKSELLISYKDGNLYGEQYLPDPIPDSAMPFIILSHGMYSSYQATGITAQLLTSHGFGCYCFDFKGCSYSNRSGGDLNNCSILTEKEELEAVISYFKKQDYVDTDRLYLLGQSLGGLVTSLAAAAHPGAIRGMILMYPAFNAVDYISKMFITSEDIPEVVENYMGIPGLNLGKRFFADILEVPVLEEIRKYPGPVYLIQGTADVLVPEIYAEKMKNSFSDAYLETVEGAEHGFHLDASNSTGILEFLNR